MKIRLLTTIGLLCFVHFGALAQIPTVVSPRFLEDISRKVKKLNRDLSKQSTQAVKHWEKTEKTIISRIRSVDSARVNLLSVGENLTSGQLAQNSFPYLASLDTLLTSVRFLAAATQVDLLQSNRHFPFSDALKELIDAKIKFKNLLVIQQKLAARGEFLRHHAEQFGLTKQLLKLRKQAFYLSNQVNYYKAVLNSKTRIERAVFDFLAKSSKFREFWTSHSEFSSLFRGQSGQLLTVEGPLQTRGSTGELLEQKLAAGGPDAGAALAQLTAGAYAALEKVKQQIPNGQSVSTQNSSDGFTPNSQRGMPLGKRLQPSFSAQSAQRNNYFPMVAEVGASIGYKVSDRLTAGIGVGYKAGLGAAWNALKLTNEGISFRSFVDWKLKGTFWASGGFEYQHNRAFRRFERLLDQSAWQPAGLVGLSKVLSIQTRFLKQTKLQVMWDFLSYRHNSLNPPIVFRIYYCLN